MNPGEWKNDPRLAAMDPVKLQYIEKIAAQISSQSKAELFPALLSLQLMPGKAIFPSPTRKPRF